MDISNTVLSAPLQKLKDEHVSLREDMDVIYDLAEEIEYESGAEVIELFAKLYEQVLTFSVRLKTHSKKEDDGLFPMMIRHLGKDDRNITSMEFEHDKAEQHLHEFLQEGDMAGTAMDEEVAQSITVYAVQAHATLIQHFAKEESMLFPLAEKILTDEEKAELARLF